jgi:predicted transcriptional regulator
VPILGRVSEYNIASILNYESNGPTPIAPELEAVSATAPLGETLDLMSKHDYSQLGIEENGSISGVVSYRSVVETQLVLSEMDDYSGG